MDNNISELLNKALSNPEMLETISAMLPAVSAIMGGDKGGGKDKKIVETTALPQSSEAAEPQNNPPSSPTSRQSIEQLIADEAVTAAFKNLVTAINAAQNIQPDSLPQTNSDNPEKAENTSELGNILGSLMAKMSDTEKSAADDESNGDGGIEKALNLFKNFSAVTGPDKDERVKLLLALKPFLKDERQGKVDTAIKYMSVAKIINVFGKNGFV